MRRLFIFLQAVLLFVAPLASMADCARCCLQTTARESGQTAPGAGGCCATKGKRGATPVQLAASDWAVTNDGAKAPMQDCRCSAGEPMQQKAPGKQTQTGDDGSRAIEWICANVYILSFHLESAAPGQLIRPRGPLNSANQKRPAVLRC